MPQPPGFFGYPQPPPLPHLVDPMPGPFTYPVSFYFYNLYVWYSKYLFL